MQTILGGNGTIGSVLAKELTAYTDKIRIVGRNPKPVNETDEVFIADVTDKNQLDAAINGSEVVYLLIGFEYTAKAWQEKWYPLMRNTIDACKENNSRLVFFDNVYMYDKNSLGNMTEETPVNPPSKKGKVRADIAKMLMDEAQGGGIQALIARSADFYGPGNERSVLVETVVKYLAKGKNGMWFGSGNKKHNFTYTPDAGKAVAMLGNTPDAFNQVWHMPTDKNAFTGKEWIKIFAKEMKVKNASTVIPKFVISAMGLFDPFMKEFSEMVYQYQTDYVFNSDKFNKRFNFTPTDYREGVKKTVEWVKGK
jgi:nucleoside-diphosphate-sugar epimerase